jgi:hypothetical protein
MGHTPNMTITSITQTKRKATWKICERYATSFASFPVDLEAIVGSSQVQM